MIVTCDVRRFEPDVDTKLRYERYRLDVEATETVLDVLIRIYRQHDPALSFRFACGVIKCGECAIAVNGSPCLACEKLVEPEMKIDPLPNLPLIKDLVIDRRKVFGRIFGLLPALSRAKGGRDRVDGLDTDIANDYVRLTKCFECLICQSSCPVSAETTGEFVGPLGLLWLAQKLLDPRNEADVRQDGKKAFAMCERCGLCSSVCPCSEDILKLALTTLERG
jgi:succinate dehydrogenase/fumarate reductase iron-sulfur protein